MECSYFKSKAFFGSDTLSLISVYVQMRKTLALSSKRCLRLIPRSGTIEMVILEIVLRTAGSFSTSSSCATLTLSNMDEPMYLMFHLSANLLPLAPKPRMR